MHSHQGLCLWSSGSELQVTQVSASIGCISVSLVENGTGLEPTGASAGNFPVSFLFLQILKPDLSLSESDFYIPNFLQTIHK